MTLETKVDGGAWLRSISTLKNTRLDGVDGRGTLTVDREEDVCVTVMGTNSLEMNEGECALLPLGRILALHRAAAPWGFMDKITSPIRAFSTRMMPTPHVGVRGVRGESDFSISAALRERQMIAQIGWAA